MSENREQASPNTACNMGGGGGLRTPDLLGEGRSSIASHLHCSNASRSLASGGGKERETGNWHTETW